MSSSTSASQPSSSSRKRVADDAGPSTALPESKRTRVEEAVASNSHTPLSPTKRASIPPKANSANNRDKKRKRKKKRKQSVTATSPDRVDEEEDVEDNEVLPNNPEHEKENIPQDVIPIASSSTLSSPLTPRTPEDTVPQTLAPKSPEPLLTLQDSTTAPEPTPGPSRSTQPAAFTSTDAKDLAAHHALLSTMLPSLTCQICLLLMHRPFMLAPCGHAACHDCLVTWFSNDPGQPVPDNQPAQAQAGASGGDEGNNNAAAPIPHLPPIPPLPVVRRKKTCPHCRAVVRERPIEAWAIKDMVSAIVKSGLAEQDSIPAGMQAGSSSSGSGTPNANNDPWANIFPSVASVNRNRAEIQRIRERERFGIEDEEDGVWRCVDCASEIWDSFCSGCGRPYPGHAHAGGPAAGPLFDPFNDEDVELYDGEPFVDGPYRDGDFMGFVAGLMGFNRYMDGDDEEDDEDSDEGDDDVGEPGFIVDDDEDEDEDRYEASFIDDDEDVGEGGSGSELSWGVRESGESHDDPIVINHGESDEEGPITARIRSRRIIASDDEDEEEEEAEYYDDLAAMVAQRERELYGDDGSVPIREDSRAEDSEDEEGRWSENSDYGMNARRRMRGGMGFVDDPEEEYSSLDEDNEGSVDSGWY